MLAQFSNLFLHGLKIAVTLSLSNNWEGIYIILGFPGGTVVKTPRANVGDAGETGIQSLGQEDPLEEKMATHFNIPAWKIPWTEEPHGLQSMGSQRVRHD